MVDFSLIKAKIQRHKLSSLIHNTLELLNGVQRQKDKTYPIWNLFSLLKWAYLHTDNSILRKSIKEEEFFLLLELIRKFEGQYNGINFKSPSSFKSSLKIIANQQFPLQDLFHNIVLSRQIVLYLKLKSSTKFNLEEEFKNLTGIGIKAFLEYSYFTFFFFNFEKVRPDLRYNGTLSEDYFDLFQTQWDAENLNTYLNLLTLKDRKDFEKLQKLNNEVLQLYETNFFMLKPFIHFRGQYWIPHKYVFTQTVKHFIYNYLKENSTRFPEEFGKRLEKYVELGLIENRISYQSETALKTTYGSGKVCDFVINSNILVEVKAIELHPRSGVQRTRNILVNDLDNTIIKAYTQMLELAHKMNSNKVNYGIIITYKDMYLGFGADAWDEFLKERIEVFCIKSGIQLSILPPQNLFFISIEDWDYIMQAIKEGKASLIEILKKGQELNSLENKFESVLLMEQVISRYFQPTEITLSYLKNVHQQLDILSRMK